MSIDVETKKTVKSITKKYKYGFTTKVDEISFHMLSGNINTGTLSLYGIKL